MATEQIIYRNLDPRSVACATPWIDVAKAKWLSGMVRVRDTVGSTAAAGVVWSLQVSDDGSEPETIASTMAAAQTIGNSGLIQWANVSGYARIRLAVTTAVNPLGGSTLPTAPAVLQEAVFTLRDDEVPLVSTGGGGSGTVTTFSVVTANGVSATVANATTTPAATFTLGAITPTSVNGVTFSGSSTPTLAVTGTSSISGANTGDQTITLTGDVTGSGTGSFAATIASGAVSLAKMANMATASLIYRKTAGSGAPEVNTLATLKTDLGLTGTNSGDQTITLTGDVTGSGTGSFAATIANGAVTGAKMATAARTKVIRFKFYSGDAANSTDQLLLPWAATITKATIYTDATISAVIDVKTGTTPTNPTTLCGGTKPTLSSSSTPSSTALGSWSTSLTAGNYLQVNLDSVTWGTATYVELDIEVTV